VKKATELEIKLISSLGYNATVKETTKDTPIEIHI